MTAEELMKMDLDAVVKLLPFRTDDIRDTAMIGRAGDNERWSVVYQDHVIVDKSAKVAVIKLLTILGVVDG